MAGALTGLGMVSISRKNFAEGEKFLSKALTVYEQLEAATRASGGSNMQAQLECKAELADTCLALNRLDKAAFYYKDVINKIPYCISDNELKEKTIANYAKVLRLMGNKHEAKIVASGAQSGSAARRNWEGAYRKAADATFSRNFEKADTEINDALSIATQLGNQSNELNLTLRAQAELFYEQGRYNAARGAAEQALAIKQREIGAEDFEVERDLLMLAKISIAQENWHTAKDYLDRQYRLARKSQLQRLTQIAENRAYMALAYEKLGEKKSADELIADAKNAIVQAKKRPRIANSLAILGTVYDGRGDFINAQNSYIQALEILHSNNSDRRLLEPQILLEIGNSYSRSGAMDKARANYYAALGLLTNKFDPLVATTLAHYALTELKAGSKEKAEKLASQAMKSMPTYPDSVHVDFSSTMAEYQKLAASTKQYPALSAER